MQTQPLYEGLRTCRAQQSHSAVRHEIKAYAELLGTGFLLWVLWTLGACI
jgi:hypothetical protein